jgi:hypothetical protein
MVKPNSVNHFTSYLFKYSLLMLNNKTYKNDNSQGR